MEFSGVESLQAKAHASVLKNLGALADTRFCCGGVLSPPDSVQVSLLNTDRKVIRFPCEDESSIQELVDACAIASFGVGKEKVTDTSYRNALKLESDEFLTSFQLCDTSVLGEIQRILVPKVRDPVRAQLYKLNVYGPGGHFKAHVDTPRGQEMFGSLVVCLPSRFTGGALSVRHQSKEVVFDWSSNPAHKIQWAAFFSDVEHEVLPVADGYRVTLTYNLYHSEKIGSAVNPERSPFHRELAAALSNPHFMREGGVLGFACRHNYVLTDLNSVESSPLLLKGADHNVYAAAKSLGLSVCLKPTVVGDIWLSPIHDLIISSFHDQVITEAFFDKSDESGDEFIQELFRSEPIPETDFGITWCWKKKIKSTLATFRTYAYTRRDSVGCFYQAAAIFVAVPKWSAERGSGSCATGKDDVWKMIGIRTCNDLEEIQQSMEAIEEKMKGYLSRSSFGGRGYCRLDSKKMQLCYEQKRVVKKLEEQCKKDSIFTDLGDIQRRMEAVDQKMSFNQKRKDYDQLCEEKKQLRCEQKMSIDNLEAKCRRLE